MIYLWIVLALLLAALAALLFMKAKVVLEYNNGYFRIIFRSGLIRVSVDSKTVERLSAKRKAAGTKKKTEKEEKDPHKKFFDKEDRIKE